jgi:serine/threonine protein kinase
VDYRRKGIVKPSQDIATLLNLEEVVVPQRRTGPLAITKSARISWDGENMPLQINQYRIIQEIGFGSFGSVLCAVDTNSGMVYVRNSV